MPIENNAYIYESMPLVTMPRGVDATRMEPLRMKAPGSFAYPIFQKVTWQLFILHQTQNEAFIIPLFF